WLDEFKKALLHKFSALRFRAHNFKCILSYDIDMAYSYLYKGWARTAGGFARAFIKGQWTAIKDRWQVLRRQKKDPYDCFEWLDALHLYCRVQPYFFFLVAKNRGRYDKNTSTDAQLFQNLV